MKSQHARAQIIICVSFGVLALCVPLSFAFADTAYVFNADLHVGDTGIEVETLQHYLNTHGFLLASSGSGSAGNETDYFGALTYDTLEKFQDAHAQQILAPLGLQAGTGILGFSTRAYINGYDNGQGSLAGSVSASVPEAATSTDAPCAAPAGLSCYPGTAIIEPWAPSNGWTPGFGVGSPTQTAATPPAVSVTASTSNATLYVGETTTFGVTVSNTSNTAVTWSATGGTIDAAGDFTVPSTVSATTTIVVTATSQADPSKSASITVTVPPVMVTVSPSSTSIASNATTTFSVFVQNATTSAVTWSASGGSINSGGLFTAPNVVATTTYTITASSTFDMNRAASSTVTVAPVNGLVDEWPLNINDAAVASDTADGANNGTWSGTQIGTQGYYATGWDSNLAGDFDGTTDYVATPATYSYSPTTSFSWTAWVYVNSNNSSQDVVILGDRHTSDWIKLTPSAFEYATGSIINNNIPTNTWKFIAITDSAGSFTYYQNGSVIGTATDNSDSFSDIPFSIGTDPVGESDGLFDGQVGDVRVYNTALTQSQVTSLYNSTK